MQKLEYFFGLRLAILRLRYNDNLSASLQPKDFCATEAQKIWKTAAETLKKMRYYEEFELFWKDVKKRKQHIYVSILQSYRGKGEQHL